MRIAIQIISVVFSIVLIILACLVLPAEGLVKALAIVGIITAALCMIAVIAWAVIHSSYVSEAEDNRRWRMKHL